MITIHDFFLITEDANKVITDATATPSAVATSNVSYVSVVKAGTGIYDVRIATAAHNSSAYVKFQWVVDAITYTREVHLAIEGTVEAINDDATQQALQSDATLAAAIFNKQNVTDNLDGTYDIAVRNSDDDGTLRTIRYNPTSGAKTVVS